MSAKEKQKFKDLAKREKPCYDLEVKNYVLPKGDEIKKGGGDPIDQERPLSASFCFISNNNKRSKVNTLVSIGDTAKKLGEMWP